MDTKNDGPWENVCGDKTQGDVFADDWNNQVQEMITYRIHGTGIFTYIWLKVMVHVTHIWLKVMVNVTHIGLKVMVNVAHIWLKVMVNVTHIWLKSYGKCR